MRNCFKYLLVIIVLMLTASCSVTRHIPKDQYLLRKNLVEVEKEKGLPKEEQIAKSDLEKYLYQKPTRRILGLNIPLGIYSLSNPVRENTWWNRLKRRIGSEPVLLDSTSVQRSEESMKIYMGSRGFLNSNVSSAIDTADRKATVIYKISQGDPYRLGQIKYQFNDQFVKSLILDDTVNTLIRTGGIFDADVLSQERVRITSFLKNRGYYNFSINNISYIADTTVGEHRVNLTMVVKQYMAGYNENGEPIMDNNRIYRIKDIYVYPGYNPTAAAADPNYKSRLDTMLYKGLHIVYDTRQGVRPEILRRSISLYPNYVYSAEAVKRTSDNIMLLRYYKSTNILFAEVSDSTSADNLVTFVDQTPGDTTQAEYTTEGYLDCHILCTPSAKQSITLELEGTTSSDYFGIVGKVGYQNRNLFRRVAVLDLGFRGGYEFMRVKGKKNSFEIGGSASLSFPRFITPFRIDRYNKAFNPRTRIEFSYNVQRRPYYHRTISSGAWGYLWGNGKNSTFVFKPIDISVVKLSQVDQDFIDSLKNPYLQNSYKSQVIAGLSGSYVFNNQLKNVERNSLSIRVNYETNGNLIDGLSHLFSRKDQEYHKLFGIRYAQYFRTDVNIARKFVIGHKSSIVYRFYTGWGLAYGNSTSIPFERLFYCGGANSMRGWMARTLGPGSVPRPTHVLYAQQLGNFKLETNLEGRFPVWGILHGALFFDLGNIWFAGQGGSDPAGVFHFNTFYKQLGFNTGLGARFDFSFFVFRLDWGIKLHDPNSPVGQRWIHNFKLRNTTLNFAVGYPF